MILTTGDVAKRLDVDTQTVRRWCENGRLGATRMGNQYAITEADFGKFKVNYRPYQKSGRSPSRRPALRRAIQRIKT
jgi:excisionase family DNA binding protein